MWKYGIFLTWTWSNSHTKQYKLLQVSAVWHGVQIVVIKSQLVHRWWTIIYIFGIHSALAFHWHPWMVIVTSRLGSYGSTHRHLLWIHRRLVRKVTTFTYRRFRSKRWMLRFRRLELLAAYARMLERWHAQASFSLWQLQATSKYPNDSIVTQFARSHRVLTRIYRYDSHPPWNYLSEIDSI